MESPPPTSIDQPGSPQDSPLILQSGGVTYYVTNPSYLSSGDGLTCEAHVISPTSINTRLTLRSTQAQNGALSSLRIELTDLLDNELFRARFDVDQAGDTTVVAQEALPSDSLTWTWRFHNGLVEESYVLNGETFQLTWDPNETVPDSLRDAFLEFMPANCPLNNTEEGIMAMRIATSAEFRSWIENTLGPSGSAMVAPLADRTFLNPPAYELFCGGLGGICAFKCILFPTNPLCGACGILGIICVLWGFACLWNPQLCQ